MLELRAFAVGRKGNLAAALSERLKHLPDAVKGFDPWQILGFVDLSLYLQNLLSLGLAKPGFDDLKGLARLRNYARAAKIGVVPILRARKAECGCSRECVPKHTFEKVDPPTLPRSRRSSCVSRAEASAILANLEISFLAD